MQASRIAQRREKKRTKGGKQRSIAQKITDEDLATKKRNKTRQKKMQKFGWSTYVAYCHMLKSSAKSTMKAAVKARCCQGDAAPSQGTAKSLATCDMEGGHGAEILWNNMEQYRTLMTSRFKGDINM